MRIHNTLQRGQVVLITLLVLTLATTVALSLISRTTTDVAISSQIEESSRAFSAAEAGIEEALRSGLGSGGPMSIVGAAGVQYTVNKIDIGNAIGLYEFPRKTLRGETETVWLVPHVAGTNDLDEASINRFMGNSISICWSSETVTPALVATLLYKQGGVYKTTKLAYDPNSGRAGSNNFTSTYDAAGCGGTSGTAYKETITFASLSPAISPASDILIALRLRPLYSDTKIVINSDGSVLPLQGNKLESTGTTDSGTNRKIVVYQQYKSPSSIFDAAIYSQGSLTK